MDMMNFIPIKADHLHTTIVYILIYIQYILIKIFQTGW